MDSTNDILFLFLVREMVEDVQLGDYFIGKGTAIMVPIHLMNHNPKYFPNVSNLLY